MNHRFVMYALGRLLQTLAAVMVVPAGIAYVQLWPKPFPSMLGDGSFGGFVWAILLALALGTALAAVPQRQQRGSAVREGFAIVAFGWVLLTAIGAVPVCAYFLSLVERPGLGDVSRCCADAFFEVMSGFSTTGASVIPDVESVPAAILFWRSLTHWLGGMGIVTLVLAVFPAFGVAGYHMFRGEMPGPVKERFVPRLAQTAKVLWVVYAGLTLFEMLLLWAGGMSLFDSVCHAFGTMATGGFSTRNASIGAYSSGYIDWVVTVFMFLAGANFMLHYGVLFHGRLSVLRDDPEFRFYAAVLALAIVFGTAIVWSQGVVDRTTAMRSYRSSAPSAESMQQRLKDEGAKVRTLYGAFRRVAFQVVSITTTTGYVTADFDVWPGPVRLMLVALMFFGGCAGSTAGGIKMVRMLVVLKAVGREVRREVEPRAIMPVRIARSAIGERQVQDIIGFFCVFVISFVLFSGVMSLFMPDLVTAVTAVAATLCNVGPGLASVGATETYAAVPTAGKWVLSLCMLLGRLEIFTVLIAISPVSWRR